MEGDRKGGFSIFWADDGLDTGPLLLQRECYIGENDTVDSVYNGFMYPVGKCRCRIFLRKKSSQTQFSDGSFQVYMDRG